MIDIFVLCIFHRLIVANSVNLNYSIYKILNFIFYEIQFILEDYSKGASVKILCEFYNSMKK